jgi:hypothetical protein
VCVIISIAYLDIIISVNDLDTTGDDSGDVFRPDGCDVGYRKVTLPCVNVRSDLPDHTYICLDSQNIALEPNGMRTNKDAAVHHDFDYESASIGYALLDLNLCQSTQTHYRSAPRSRSHRNAFSIP